jgi:asparagine synthase (glutamine-hydrolysing)
MGLLPTMDYPFIAIRTGPAGKVEVSGQTEASLGHAYAGADPSLREGVYAEWKWDGQQLEAEVDHLGFFSLFYCDLGNGVMVSPSLIQLIAQGAPSELDDDALGVFFNIGFFLEEETPFAKIKVLPPNGKLVWRAGSLTVTGGVDIPPESNCNRKQAVEGFAELFRASVRRAIDSCDQKYVVPLSGGRDSRHIVLEMKAQNRLPHACITYNYRLDGLDAEATSAKMVADAVGARHEIIGGSKSPLRDNLRAVIFTSLCADEHFQMTPLRDYALTHAPLYAFDGIGGDVLSRSKNLGRADLLEMCRTGKWTAVAEDFVNGHHGLVRWSPADEIDAAEAERRFGRSTAVERIAKALSKFASAAHPVTAFLMNARTRREISFVSTAVIMPAKPVCPFLDRELVTFLKALPAAATADAKLHEELTKTVYPEYAKVPYWDELKLPSGGRHSALWRLNRVREAISAMASIHPKLGLSEVFTEGRMLYDRERRHQYIHRLHFLCVNACRDARSAGRMLQALSRMDAAAV